MSNEIKNKDYKSLEYLAEARAALLEEKEDHGLSSRELSLALTKIDEAMMWRHSDINKKDQQMFQENWNFKSE